MKKGYAFVFGVDGFGYDVSPAYEEGVYLDYDKAFAHLVELNAEQLTVFESPMLDDDDCPMTDPEEICRCLVEDRDDPPINFYTIVEIDIHE